jgi:hypothetical protein
MVWVWVVGVWVVGGGMGGKEEEKEGVMGEGKGEGKGEGRVEEKEEGREEGRGGECLIVIGYRLTRSAHCSLLQCNG